jgi:hypothetical protein
MTDEEMEQIEAIIRQLRKADNLLFDRRLKAGSSEERARLRAESHAISARIERLQGILFSGGVAEFDADLAEIATATRDIKQAIKDIEDFINVLGGIADILKIVDTVIGLFP